MGFEYKGRIVLLTEDRIPEETKNEWLDTLKREQSHIGTNLLNKIPDEETFKDLIAEASSDAWEAFVNPNWPNADVVKIKQRVKLAARYGDWNSGVQATFFDGYFSDRVEAKKAKWNRVRYVLSVVGLQHDPVIRWRAGTKAVKCFVGDKRVVRYWITETEGGATAVDEIRPSADQIDMYVKPAYGKRFQALVLGRIVQAYIFAKLAEEGGLIDLRDQIISDFNSDMDTILAAALDPAKADPTKSFLHLTIEGAEYKIHAKAEL